MNHWIARTCLVMLCLLTACTLPQEHYPELNQANRPEFKIDGAIAARNQHQGWMATFTWIQYKRHDYEIFLHGPLGSDGITITQHQGIVTYSDGQTIRRSSHPDNLLAQETGVRIPIKNLYDWIQGRPAPGPVITVQHTAESPHDITRIEQAGFIIHYDYRQHHPHKIRIEGQGMIIKIVIKHWSS